VLLLVCVVLVGRILKEKCRLEKSSPSQSSLYSFLRWFVTPRHAPEDTGELRRHSLILGFLLLLCCISGLSVIALLLTARFAPVALAILGLYIGIYAMGRFGSPDWAIRIVIGILLGLPYAAVLIQPESFHLFSLLFLALLALLIASIFTKFRLSLVVAIFAFAMVFSLNIIISGGSPVDSLNILIPSLVVTLLLLFNAYQRGLTPSPSIAQSYDFYPEAVLIQLDTKIVYANPAALRLLARDSNDTLTGKAITDYVPISSSQYHVKNEDGRFVLRYIETVPSQERKLQITTSSIPYGKELATLWLLRPLEATPIVVDSAEKSFHTLSRIMSDYAYSLDVKPDGSLKFLWVAGAISQIVGLSDEKVLALKGWESLVHPQDLAFFRMRQNALLNGEQRSLEYRILRPDGTFRWVQDNANPLRDSETQQVYRILGEAHDITERIQAQEVLRSHVVQQAVVAELGLLALSLFEPIHLLSHAVVLCEQVLDANLCVILEHDAEKHELICRSSSRPDGVLQAGKTLSDSAQSSLAAYTLFAQEAIVSENLVQESRYQSLPEIIEAQYRSAMSVVILGQKMPYGVMCVYSQKHQVFDNDEIYFLQSVSNVLGTFIERHRAQAAEREQREFAEALRDATAMINSRLELPDVLKKILSYLPQVVPAMESASVMLYNEDDELYQFVNTWGYDEDVAEIIQAQLYPKERFPLLNRMIDSKRPLVIANVDEEALWFYTTDIEIIHSYLGSPIFVQGNFIGFLHVNSSKFNAFGLKDAERIQSFADKIGTAILNARHAEDLERLVKIRTDELNKQREQLAAILEGTGEGIVYSEAGVYIFANRRFCEMTGYAAHELIGKNSRIFWPGDISPEEQETLRKSREQIDRGETTRLAVRFVRKDKSPFEAEITSSRISSADESVIRVVSMMRDISQEKELANLKNLFIANAAHDLRSPITSLKTRMYLIEKQPEQMPYHLEKLEQVISRMNRLVGDLLDSAAFGQGKVVLRQESIILQDVLQSIVDLLRPEAEEVGLELVLQMPELPLHIWADSMRLEQVFTNLITNAIHYTPSGKVLVHCHKNETLAHIEVIDTGAGIPETELELIFQPFYRLSQNAKIKGTGLGLSITRDIVERHGGKISVSSEVGKGSCFDVSLPLLKE
jgi:PAS domain S-box-containing protein